MKIRKTDLEIVQLTAKELILNIFDLTTPFYIASRLYRKSINKYLEQRAVDRSNFLLRIQYLRRQGFVRTFTENKEKYLELTPNGLEHIKTKLLDNLEIKRPQKWDGKWRVVIFDVPEKMHRSRDLFRDHLKALNFIQIQKSVYVYPFESTQEITVIAEAFNITKYVTIMISEIIQGEEEIIEGFLDKKVLLKSDLKKAKIDKIKSMSKIYGRIKIARNFVSLIIV